MKIRQNLPYHDASVFSWAEQKGIAEASDLGCRAGELPFAQVYDDAADVGCLLVNPATARELLFVFERNLINRNSEQYGECHGWALRSAGYVRNGRIVEPNTNFTIEILND